MLYIRCKFRFHKVDLGREGAAGGGLLRGAFKFHKVDLGRYYADSRYLGRGGFKFHKVDLGHVPGGVHGIVVEEV